MVSNKLFHCQQIEADYAWQTSARFIAIFLLKQTKMREGTIPNVWEIISSMGATGEYRTLGAREREGQATIVDTCRICQFW
jgi:hypothetical protein